MDGVFELWSDFEGAGGSAERAIPDFVDARIDESLQGEDTLLLDVPAAGDVWPLVDQRNVVRLDLDGAIREWRVRDLDERLSEDGRELGRLEAEGPWMELLGAGSMLERVEENGLAQPHFEVYQQAPSVHLDIILGNLGPYESGAPAWFGAGTVEFSDPVDMIYDWDTPLAALDELLKQIGGSAERALRRQSDGTYLIDLVEQVASSATTVYLAAGRNAIDARHRESAKDMVNRVHPRGGGEPGGRTSLADNAFPIASVSGSTVTADDRLMVEDGQLDGLYVEKPDGSLTEVTASSAPSSVTLADASDIGAGDALVFRRNAQGDELTYLDLPSSIATHGRVFGIIDRPSLPPINNLLQNAYLSTWSGGLPDGWAAVGAPTVAQNTDPLFTRFGGSSAHVVADAGDGIATVATPVSPTAERPYFTGQMSLWLAAGRVRIQLLDVTNGDVWPPDDADRNEVTDEKGVWIDNLGVRPGEDFFGRATEQMIVQLLAVEDGTEVYVDAAQLTQTEGGHDTFFHDRASNLLWQEALNELTVRGEPTSSYEVRSVDLNRLDPDRWPDEEMVLGGSVTVHVPDWGVEASSRVARKRWRPHAEGDTQLDLETEEDRLSRLLAASERRRRSRRPDRPQQVEVPDDVTGFQGEFPGEFLLLKWNVARGAGRYVIREQGAGDTALERWENGTPFGNTDGTTFVERNPDSSEFELTIRALNPRTGRWSRTPTELEITAEGADTPCENFVEPDDAAETERCSTKTDVDEVYHEFTPIPLARLGVDQGDFVAVGWEGKIIPDAAAGAITPIGSIQATATINPGDGPAFCAADPVRDYAYTVTELDDNFRVIDVSDPENPAVVASVEVPGGAGWIGLGVCTLDGYVYYVDRVTSNGELAVVNVEDPLDPRTGDGAGSQLLSDSREVVLGPGQDFCYVARNTGTGRIVCYNVSARMSPTHVVTQAAGERVTGIEFVPGTDLMVYVASENGEVGIVDWSTPSAPNLVSNIVDAALAGADSTITVNAAGTRAYIGRPGASTVRVVNIADREALEYGGAVQVDGWTHGIAELQREKATNLLHVRASGGEYGIFDVSDPDAPVLQSYIGSPAIGGTDMDAPGIVAGTSADHSYGVSKTADSFHVAEPFDTSGVVYQDVDLEVALVVADPADASTTNTQAALEAKGHVVTVVDDADFAATDFAPYDAVVVSRPSSGLAAADVRAELDAGTPMVLGLVDAGETAGGAQSTLPTRMDLTGTVEVVDSTPGVDEVDVTDDTHFVTGLQSLGALLVREAGCYGGAVEDPAQTVGDVLADADPDAPDGLAGPALEAVDAGTNDLAGSAVGAPVVVMPTYAKQAAWTVGGRNLLNDALLWVTGNRATTAAEDVDLWSTVQIAFLDADGDDLLPVTVPRGTNASSYERASGNAEVPANADRVQVRYLREGPTLGKACARRLQVNPGKIACEFEPPEREQCPNLMGGDAGPEKLVSNAATSPEMDTDTDGDGVVDDWTHAGGGTPSVDLEAQRVDAAVADAPPVIEQLQTGIEPGRAYNWESAHRLQVDGGAPQLEKEVEWQQADGTPISTSGPASITPRNEFQRSFSTVTAPAGAAQAVTRIRMAKDTTDDAGVMWVRHAWWGLKRRRYRPVDLATLGIDPADEVDLAWMWEGQIVSDPGPLSTLGVAVNVEFLDSNGDVVWRSQELDVNSVAAWARGVGNDVTAAGNVEARMVVDRYGTGFADVKARRVQLNQGTEPCDFGEPGGAGAIESLGVDVVVDTCAGGGGASLDVFWEAGGLFTSPDFDVEVEYFVDGSREARYTGIDPQAGEHSHVMGGVGSDAASVSDHEVYVVMTISTTNTVTFGGESRTFTFVAAQGTSPTVTASWGTC